MRVICILLTLASTALATCLTAPAALASNFGVAPGGNWGASLISGSSVVLEDTTAHLQLTCTAATLGGTFSKSGSGFGIGTVTAATFGKAAAKCSGPLGSTSTGQIKTGSTWTVSFISTVNGVTDMEFSNFDAVFSVSSVLGTCDIEIKSSGTGTLTAFYHNASADLTISQAVLAVTAVTGGGACMGIANGDAVDVATDTDGSYAVNPAQVITES